VLLVGCVAGRSSDVAQGPTGTGLPTPQGSVVPSAIPSETPQPHPTLSPPRGPLDGYLLIADRGNNRILLVDGRKRVLWNYPGKRTPSIPFRYDDDAFFGANYRSIITNQEDQHTMEVVSFPAGDVLWHYGHVDRPGSSRGYLHTPDDAYLLDNGRRTVADVGNCRILFISRHKKIVRQIGTTGSCTHDPPRSLASPNGDTPYSGGRTLITEIGGSWVDAVDKHGKLLWSVQAPMTYPSDAQWLGHGRMLLADYTAPGKVAIMKKSGRVLWSYGPTSGPGTLDHPSLALMLPNGNIVVNDDFHDRIVIIDPKKNKIVWQYGHLNSPGTKAGYLHIPDGMDFLPYEVAQSSPALRELIHRKEGRGARR
ncbi:MAG: hypothetical protein QOF16_431, partial [Actinomycetota bacterium]|nr:hypothetical protein [Actinomycetota bacterium]